MAKKTFKFFDALPAYFGGKRKLVKAIFKLAPPANDAPVFFDAFLGGGSVSLYAKALGYQVISNDIADRSAIIGRALIENNRAKLHPTDIYRLFEFHENANDGFVSKVFSPEVFMTRHAEFLDIAFHNLRRMPESPKKALLELLLVKFIFKLRPHNQFSSPHAFNIPMEDRRMDFIKRTYWQHIKTLQKPIPDLLLDVLEAVNSGVIDNGKINQAHKRDIMDLLPDVKADIVYFDPPYAGTTAYEDVYHTLDQILAGRTFRAEKNEFSDEDGQKFIKKLFERARHIPVWILSMGNAGGKNDCLVELAEMMAQYKQVKTHVFKYEHKHVSANEEHKDKNLEYLILGTQR